MIQLTITEVAQLKTMREQADAGAIGYREIYKTLADLLQSKYGVSPTEIAEIWVRAKIIMM